MTELLAPQIPNPSCSDPYCYALRVLETSIRQLHRRTVAWYSNETATKGLKSSSCDVELVNIQCNCIIRDH